MIEKQLIRHPVTWVLSAVGLVGQFAGFLDPLLGWILGHAATIFALAGVGVRLGDLPGWVLPVVGVVYATSLVIRLGESALRNFAGGGA